MSGCRANSPSSIRSWPPSPRSRRAEAERDDLQQLVDDPASDPEMATLAEAELETLGPRIDAFELELKVRLLPKDSADEKSAILEVRAGTGGEEAALVRRRSLPHVSALCRPAWLEGRRALRQRIGQRRLQGNHRQHHRQGRVCASQIRIGRASRAARARDRGARAHPHLGRDRGGAARGRRGRHQDRRQGFAHRRVPRQRPRRPVGQHHRQRGQDHPSAIGARGRSSRTRSRSTRTRPRR